MTAKCVLDTARRRRNELLRGLVEELHGCRIGTGPIPAADPMPRSLTEARPTPASLSVRLLRPLPADDVGDVSAFDVVDETSDDLEGFEVWLGDQELDVFA
jgi:hypothetical protein